MKPGLRFFVAGHLVAVGAIYDIAPPWSVGSDGRVRLADR